MIHDRLEQLQSNWIVGFGQRYLFFAFFFFAAVGGFFAVALVLVFFFFCPNALLQFSEYFLLVPLRKIVMALSLF
jgi:hypothetical protein